MSKSEVLELSKARSKEIFKEHLKESGDFDILDEDIEVVGLKEYEGKFCIMVTCQKVKNICIKFLLTKRSGRLTHAIFKKI